jgi:hypothetical protein
VNIHGGSVGAESGPHKPYPDSATKPHAKPQRKETNKIPSREGGRCPDECVPREKNAVAM